MGAEALSKRLNWQTISGKNAKRKELLVKDALQDCLRHEGDYKVIYQPQDFASIYSDKIYPDGLPDVILDNIYRPKEPSNCFKWGFVPDYAIENRRTGKKIFIELKTQNGWVEGGKPADGRGNVHERACKHFTPGITKLERKVSGINDINFKPFIIIFTGNITLDPRRNSEIYFWFQGYEDNYFMWRPDPDGMYPIKTLFNYIKYKVLPHLS